NDTHRPSQDSARNNPAAVAIEASAGHSRSQNNDNRARPSARESMAAPARASRSSSSFSVFGSVKHGSGSESASYQHPSTRLGPHHSPLQCQEIARFAHRADNVGQGPARSRRGFGNGLNLMEGLIERRPNEIVHGRIDNDEGLGFATLKIEDARHQDAGVADD